MADSKQRERLNASVPSLFNLTGGLLDDEKEAEIPANSLVALEDGSMQFGSYTLTSKGLVGGENADEMEWENLGKVLKRLEGAIQWLIGDWFVHAEHKWGKTYQQVAIKTGYAEKTLREYAHVARKVNLSIRMDRLSFGHHQAVASLSPDEQQMWLRKALSQSWSISQLRKAIKPPAPRDDYGEESQRANVFLQYVEQNQNSVVTMQPEKRREYIEYARWLGERYIAIAEWAAGLE